ncbi:MAG: type VI secretion system baseplate subunit TssF [Aquabacterium sp.]|uniref:type VI secretion system baseplate subunit TssF n=1 Tax=Aquabacterium sp. TaxID=1872578 RepID=UPI0025B90982|nr:type VI secretion system baseplate subunit TssF [Aquabacterium sp.]MBI3384330.1 type VI secretion system baseplate subunit TssF [Aquabacterium sp.]
MDSLLPHYERELAFLRGQSRQFASRYPKLAGRLALSSDVVEDPHVERMIESFALLAARVHKRLDDDFPLFTESLLEVLYPHYLRPFPSCSIAQFDLGAAAGQMTQPAVLSRGSVLHSRAIKGVACKFRTTQDITLLPVRLAALTYRNAVLAPEGTRVSAGVTSSISLTLELVSPQASWAVLHSRPLRVFLDGEPSQVSVLREVLCHKVIGVMVQTAPHQPWQSAESLGIGAGVLPKLAGFADEEALIDFDARSHPAYRLLTEYFAYPEKFNFIDLTVPVPFEARQPEQNDGGNGSRRTLTVHLLLSGVRADSDESRLLETIHEGSLVLGCTPVINLFKQPADPIRVSHASSSYPVLVDSRRAFGYEVYSIDRVFRVRQTPQGETVQEFRPFFSLQHDDLLRDSDHPDLDSLPSTLVRRRADVDDSMAKRVGGRYWSARWDEDVAETSPGYEMELSVVDVDFDPAMPQTDTLSLTVTATNRDLPSLLPFGATGGDLFMEGGSVAREIRLLRKATPAHRFERGRGALWRLISHLSLNHLSLSGGGIDALKEMLRLYDLPRSASNRRQIDGLVGIAFKPTTAWLPGEPYATFVRGTEVRVTVDEDSFVGTGLGLFAAVLDQFFGMYVHANSFTKLTLISARTQEEVLSCPPRNGEMPLV